jgi:hypothetical protein
MVACGEPFVKQFLGNKFHKTISRFVPNKKGLGTGFQSLLNLRYLTKTENKLRILLDAASRLSKNIFMTNHDAKIHQRGPSAPVGPDPVGPDVSPDAPSDGLIAVRPVESFLDSLMLWALPSVNGKPSAFQAIARRLARQLAPQDAVEEMLVAQMVSTCFRALRLARDAAIQTDRRSADMHYLHADRAFNLYRRQMQSLSDYRRPRTTSFTAIRNASFTAQQVIQSPAASTARPQAVEVDDLGHPAHQAEGPIIGELDELDLPAQAKAKVQPVKARPRKPAKGRP